MSSRRQCIRNCSYYWINAQHFILNTATKRELGLIKNRPGHVLKGSVFILSTSAHWQCLEVPLPQLSPENAIHYLVTEPRSQCR